MIVHWCSNESSLNWRNIIESDEDAQIT